MTLILFDIDGTLTATTNADNGCYERAFAEVFGLPLPTTEWDEYTHVTDCAILHEILTTHCNREPAPEEIDRFESRYESELARACQTNPTGFHEVPGARALLEHIETSPGIRAALATGGMRKTALFKLRQIGIDGTRMPGAFANDAHSRADIARIAIERTHAAFDRCVYVGDGMWDARTAAQLNLPFVGMAHECPEKLRHSGATHILSSYEDTASFLSAVRSAGVPRLTRQA